MQDRFSRRDMLKIIGLAGMSAVALNRLPAAFSLYEESVRTREQIDYIQKFGEDPIRMILEKFQAGVQVVGIGELHKARNMELFAADLINKVSKYKLIDFVALELDKNLQSDVDNFILFGGIDENMQNEILSWHSDGYFEIFRAARDNGLKIICADSFPKGDKRGMDRNKAMAENIINQGRGIFYAGRDHIAKEFSKLDEGLGSAYYAVMLINNAILDEGKILYKSALQTGIAVPTGIDNLSQTPLKNEAYGKFDSQESYGEMADALVLLP